MSDARRLLRSSLRAGRREVVLCVASGLAWQSVAVAVPFVLEKAVDDGVVGGDREALWAWSAVLAGLGLVRWVGDAARHWWVERAGARVADGLRRRLVDRLLAMADDDLASFDHGDLTARAVQDTRSVWNWVSGVATFATAAFTLVAVLVLLATLDPALALVGLATVPLAAVVSAARVGAHGRASAAVADGAGRYAGAVESAIAGIRTIMGLGAEQVALARAGDASDRLRARALALARVEAGWLAVAAAVPAAGLAVGLWTGGTRAIDGVVSVGALVAFAGWMGLLVDATATFAARLVDRGAALAAAGRLAELLDAPLPRQPTAPAVATVGNDVAVDGLAARRGAAVVLRGVELDVRAGEWLAVVGATGSGKTTLLRVLAGLDEPALGRVRIGGADLASLDEAARRRAATLVPQNAALVSGALGDVLRLGAPTATDAELLAALDAVAAADVLAELGGLDGRIGDRSLSLSGGQRQRLALAVAVLRRPPVLLLDDTTSALDPATEHRVLAALRDLLPTTTAVVATHRAATAAACDRVVVLADGGVVADDAASVAAVLDPAGGGRP
ncbi:MAG: ABC transporter ATP-binding protein [Acidimicrobiia bacterium]